MSWHVSPWIYPVWESLYFLDLIDLIDYFLSHIREVLTIIFSNIFSDHFFFSSSSGTPIIQMLVCLMLSQRFLKLSSILFIPFSLFCSLAVISSILSSSSLIRSSASVFLLLIPSRVFLVFLIVLFITVYLLFSSSRSLVNVSCIFSVPFPRFWIIFTVGFLFLLRLFGLVGFHLAPSSVTYFFVVSFFFFFF